MPICEKCGEDKPGRGFALHVKSCTGKSTMPHNTIEDFSQNKPEILKSGLPHNTIDKSVQVEENGIPHNTIDELKKEISEIHEIVDVLKAKSAQPIVIPEIDQLRNEIEFLKSDTAKVLARDAEEIKGLKKQIEDTLLGMKSEPICSEVVKLEEYKELDEELVTERKEYFREVQKRKAAQELKKPESKRVVIDLNLYDDGKMFL